MWLPSRNPTCNPNEQPTTITSVSPRKQPEDRHYFSCLGAEEELHNNVFGCNMLPDYSDYNTVCALIATYGSDDGTIKTKDDDATYAGK